MYNVHVLQTIHTQCQACRCGRSLTCEHSGGSEQPCELLYGLRRNIWNIYLIQQPRGKVVVVTLFPENYTKHDNVAYILKQMCSNTCVFIKVFILILFTSNLPGSRNYSTHRAGSPNKWHSTSFGHIKKAEFNKHFASYILSVEAKCSRRYWVLEWWWPESIQRHCLINAIWELEGRSTWFDS